MNIPNRVNPLSFDSSLPKGYTRLGFLESNRGQYINTGVVPSAEHGLQLDHELVVNNDLIPFGCRNEGNSDTRFYAMRAPRDVGANAFFGYGWGAWFTLWDQQGETFRVNTKLNWFNSGVAAWKEKKQTLSELGFTPIYPLYLFAANIGGVASLISQCRIWSAGITEGEQLIRSFIPALDSTGTPCMFDTVSGTPFYNNGTGQFIAGFDTVSQARLLNLPPGGGELTVSLPYEASVDAPTQEALERARVNGWLLTVQYREGELPAGWRKQVDFLESTGTQYIKTQLVPEGLSTHIQFEITTRFQATVFGYYRSGSERYQIWTRWNGGGTGVEAAIQTAESSGIISIYDKPVGYIADVEVNAEEGFISIGDSKKNVAQLATGFSSGAKDFGIFTQGTTSAAHAQTRIYFVRCWRQGEVGHNWQPALDNTGTPCMYDAVTKMPFRNDGTGQFIVGLDTVEAVRTFYLPPKAGELTLSLPQNASTDHYAQAALEKARSQGWTLQVQYREELEVPVGYKRVEFLESTGTQYIKLGLKVQGLNVKVAYYSLFGSGPISTGSVLRVANTYTKEAYSINSYKGGLGDWANIVGVETGGAVYSARQYVYSNPNFTAEINLSEGYLQAGTEKTVIPQDLQFAQPDMTPLLFAEATILGEGLDYIVQKYALIKLYSFEANYAGVPASKLIPCLDPTGTPCMYDTVSGETFRNAGTGQFTVGLSTVEDVRTLHLPSAGGSLTLSVPSTTTEADLTIIHANNPNWTLTIQIRDYE